MGAETYGRNLEQAVAAGAFGAPFYVVRETDQRFWGQDRLDFLDRHLAALYERTAPVGTGRAIRIARHWRCIA